MATYYYCDHESEYAGKTRHKKAIKGCGAYCLIIQLCCHILTLYNFVDFYDSLFWMEWIGGCQIGLSAPFFMIGIFESTDEIINIGLFETHKTEVFIHKSPQCADWEAHHAKETNFMRKYPRSWLLHAWQSTFATFDGRWINYSLLMTLQQSARSISLWVSNTKEHTPSISPVSWQNQVNNNTAHEPHVRRCIKHCCKVIISAAVSVFFARNHSPRAGKSKALCRALRSSHK